MREPGASEVLMWGDTVRPASTAFLASKPAASSTLGLEVLVQLVMAAISTSPWPKVTLGPAASVSGPCPATATAALLASSVGRFCTISATSRSAPSGSGGASGTSPVKAAVPTG